MNIHGRVFGNGKKKKGRVDDGLAQPPPLPSFHIPSLLRSRRMDQLPPLDNTCGFLLTSPRLHLNNTPGLVLPSSV